MATNDLRRTDLRTNVRINPFWLKSAEINKDVTGDLNVLFGFSEVMGKYFIHEVVVGVETLFAGGTPSLSIGYCTLDDPSVDLSVSSSDVDNYMASTEITEVTAGWYPGGAWAVDTSGVVTGADWAKAKVEGTIGELVITGADTVMPCITATVAASMTAGAARVYVLVSRIQ
jgi:hypothetical protein